MRLANLIREFGMTSLGLVSVAAALLCIAIDPRAALTGWLAAAAMLQAAPLGALVLLATMSLVPGRWEKELRVACEAASGLWSFALLAFVPILLGAGAIYAAYRSGWVLEMLFGLRTLLWFAGLAAVARRQVGGYASRAASAVMLIALVLGASLLAVDWFTLLDAGLHAPGLGLQVFAMEVCFAALVAVLLRLTRSPQTERPAIFAALLIACLLMWLCFQAMLYFVTRSASPADEITWYALRIEGPWSWVLWTFRGLGIIPLLALLFPQVRRSARAIGFAAICALAGKCLEFAWFVLPGTGPIAVLAFALALCGFACLSAAYLAPGRMRLPRRRKAASPSG